MIARALGLLALSAAIGVALPEGRTQAADQPADPAATAAVNPDLRLQTAIEDALLAHVPGAAGRNWVLQQLEREDTATGQPAFVVATGVLGTAGAPDTQVRLSGRFDPATGRLRGVSYRLQAPDAEPVAAPATGESRWNVQAAVNHAFTQVAPDERIAFALDSAEASRVEGGGRRFDGTGIGTWDAGEARHVAFTLTLSAAGELVAFDYSTAEGGSPLGPVEYFEDTLTAAR